MSDAALRAVADAARSHRARLVALLAARSRDLAGAEDAVAEALRQALEAWPARGVPDRPAAWLMTAAKRAMGQARARSATASRALPLLMLVTDEAAEEPDAWPDHRLGLLFACTHPAIDPATQTPLMLQAVLGLSAERIASAFLMSPAAMGQRLARAKQRLREAGARFERPDPAEVAPHLGQVMECILAAAALGWESVPGSDPGRADLAQEAVFLAETLADLTPDEPEPQALLAQLLYVRAREGARRSGYVPLTEQDTRLWDKALILQADLALAAAGERAQARGTLGRFQCEAAIQAVHCERSRTGRVNLAALETLHDALARLCPSTGATVAAAAVALERRGPLAAMARLDSLGPEAGSFQPYWALLAEIRLRAGHPAEAQAALARALGLTEDPGLRVWLSARMAALVP